jgi:cysteine rich repeat protein
MRVTKTIAATLLISIACAATGAAQHGPVASACKDDIPKLCPGLEHGQGEIRGCLEANKDKVSEACKTALDNTRAGR